MALPVWGNLEKSQIDDEKIEVAIARLIQAHEDDANAHVEVGESLYSHKASEIIDHLVASIIADKIKNKEININKLDWDKLLIEPSFESLNGWVEIKQGIGANIEIKGGSCRLLGGDAIGNQTKIILEGMYMSLSDVKNPFFQCIFGKIWEPTWQDIGVMSGESDPFEAKPTGFGFRWKSDEEKMYAFSSNGVILKEDEITPYDSQTDNTLRAEVVEDGAKVNFYLNGVLKITHEWTPVWVDEDYLFTFALKNRLGGADTETHIRNIIFSQDW